MYIEIKYVFYVLVKCAHASYHAICNNQQKEHGLWTWKCISDYIVTVYIT